MPSIAPATLTNSERVSSRKVSIDAAVSAGVVGNLITQLQLIISLLFFQIRYPLFSILIFHYVQLSTILKTNPGLLQISRITFPKDKRLGLLETLSSTISTVIKLGNCANLPASSSTTQNPQYTRTKPEKKNGDTSNLFLGYPNQNLFQASSITVSSKEVLNLLI